MTMTCNRLRQLIPAIALPFLSACAPQKTPYAELPKVSETEVRRYAEQSVSFGNRYSGSTELRKYADWIRETISQSTKFRSSCHEFQERTLHGDVLFHNIIAEIPGKSRKFILIAAHYDIKRFNFIKDFQGANDGASGVAALLGMISALQKYEGELPCGIKFVFFDGEEHTAVTNVGVRPTFANGNTASVESYILDYSGNLYGKRVRVEFYTFIRPERRFDCPEALRAQILTDECAVREYFKSR